MKRSGKLVCAAFLVCGAGFGLLQYRSSADDDVRKIPTEKEKSDSSEVRPFMHAKVVHAHRVFEGLVTADFNKIRKGAEALKLTSLSAPGVEPGETRDDEVYEHFKIEFLRLTSRLEELAEEENLDGAAYVHDQMNATCIACHQYLRKQPPQSQKEPSSGKAKFPR